MVLKRFNRFWTLRETRKIFRCCKILILNSVDLKMTCVILTKLYNFNCFCFLLYCLDVAISRLYYMRINFMICYNTLNIFL